jgi:hypothetical protein
MRTITVSRRVVGWLGLLAAVGVAGCTATSTSSPAATAASSPRAASGSAPAGPGGVRNLAVSRDVRDELTAAYVDLRGISVSDVAGPAGRSTLKWPHCSSLIWPHRGSGRRGGNTLIWPHRAFLAATRRRVPGKAVRLGE